MYKTLRDMRRLLCGCAIALATLNGKARARSALMPGDF